jgi:peptidoglycan/xylan/chitin deacetylase (PgdA/CDA1 family)
MRRFSRRHFFALGAGAIAGVAALRAGIFESSKADHSLDALVVDPADPKATPLIYPGGATSGSSVTGWSSDLLRQVATSGPADRKMVGLTIDDGWTAQDAVLQVLEARQVKPTLFLTGRAVKNDPSFIARAVDAGCEIGNHTMDHAWLVGQTKDYIKKDLEDFENMVRTAAPHATTLPFMRPCGGAVDQTVIDASAEAGYRPILWSASTGDTSASTTAAQMVQNAMKATAGSILLMHFSQRAVDALPAIIDGLRAKGIEPVSLSRLFAPA